MAYNYKEMKPALLTDDGQRTFLKIRDRAKELADTSGAFTIMHATSGIPGDSWLMLACIDRLVELGEFRYLSPDDEVTQYKVLVKA